MKDKIEFTEFLELEKKLEIKVGTVLKVEEVPKSNKLIKLTVSFGSSDERTVITNIKKHLTKPESLENKELLFVTNLKPATIMGIESQAMIMPGNLEAGETITTVNGSAGNVIM